MGIVKTKNRYFSVLFFSLIVMLGSLPLQAAEGVRFGPYEALTINSDVIRGVKVEEGNTIWLLLNPVYRESELIVKISNENGSGYRTWEHGGYELVSAANQGKQANEWTDWIRSKASYIEYWMSGKLILHLKKAE